MDTRRSIVGGDLPREDGSLSEKLFRDWLFGLGATPISPDLLVEMRSATLNASTSTLSLLRWEV